MKKKCDGACDGDFWQFPSPRFLPVGPQSGSNEVADIQKSELDKKVALLQVSK
jgi:hypothetical protein